MMKHAGVFAVVVLIATTGLATQPKLPAQHPPKYDQNQQIGGASSAQIEKYTIDELAHRIQKLEIEDIEHPRQQRTDWGPLATLGVAVIALFGQGFLAIREDRRANRAAERALQLAHQQALFQRDEKLLDFHLKQMEHFYAPMLALLTQMKGLYDKMRIQLVQDQPDRYRWSTDSTGKQEFQVLLDGGAWGEFRLLDQFPVVKANPRALALADQILSIGRDLTGIISQNAGLASEDLLGLLGQYMSHYTILSAIRHEENRTVAYPPRSHEMGYYPRELDDRIKRGYREVAEAIRYAATEGRRAFS